MAFAGEVETVRGRPPSPADAMFPGVCTDRVGVPLWLLWRDKKTMSSAVGNSSGKFWAFTASSFSVMSLICWPLIWDW